MTRAHIAASVLAMLTIATFWTSTLITELFLTLLALNFRDGRTLTAGKRRRAAL